MNIFTFVFFLFSTSVAFAAAPDPVIATMDSTNGYATIVGRLTERPSGPVGISVRNGNLTYSTITDMDGRWGLVIRHRAFNVLVQSWELTRPSHRSKETEVKLESGYSQ